MTQDQQDIDLIVQQHVRRRVGIAALQRAGRIVERWKEEERQDRMLWRATLLVLCVVMTLGAVYMLTHDRHTSIVAGSDMSSPSGPSPR